MRIVTYNVHSCRGTDHRVDPARIAEVIASTGADVACLQELDAGRARTGGVHQAQSVARALGMQFHFFPAIRAVAEEYGDAILSRYPVKVVRMGLLPRPSLSLEPRGAIWVEIDAGGVRWQVINTHLGLGRRERRDQARELAGWIASALDHPPVVFCGDLNSRPRSRVHALLGAGLREAQISVRGVQQRTFATWFPWICLDYIYASTGVTVESAGVCITPLAMVASDHFPLAARLSAPSSAGGHVR